MDVQTQASRPVSPSRAPALAAAPFAAPLLVAPPFAARGRDTKPAAPAG